MKALLDFIPLVIFFVIAKQQDILTATKWLLIATTIVYALHFVMQKWKLEKSQWITFILTIAFGCVTLMLQDVNYIKWKSPILNWIFGIIFLLSPLVGKPPKPLVERFLGPMLELSATAWKKLNYIWAFFFIVLGTLHALFAFIWYDMWLEFKVFGGAAIMMAFIIIQFVILRKHFKTPTA